MVISNGIATNGHNGHTIEETKVDVLIIGAGPAGVMAADMFSRFTERGLTVRIIDKRSGNLDNGTSAARVLPKTRVGGFMLMTLLKGQADGLNSRSLEIFEALGFVESIEKEGSRMVSRRAAGLDLPHPHLR